MSIRPPNPELLTHGQIPKPMHGVAPREILGQDWWDKQRRAAYQKHQFHCWACGVHKLKAKYHKWLEAHERYEIDYATGRMTFIGCCALCHSCHNFIHSGRLEALREKGEISQERHDDIIKHGIEVMRRFGLSFPEAPEEVAPWERWRMVVGEEEHPPKFASYEIWARYYGYPEDAHAYAD